MARKRLQLVRSRTTHVLAAENLFSRNTGNQPGSNTIKRYRVEDIARLG